MKARIIIAAALGATHLLAFSSTPIPFDRCFVDAADRFGLNKQMLVAIAKTESALNPNVVGPKNANGTFDVGMMQINSSWLPTLAKYGITHKDLFNACTNINVGAWILAANIDKHGHTWKAVGAYNAASQDKQVKYITKVHRNYLQVAALAGEGNKP